MGLNSFLHFIVKYTLFIINLVFTISGCVLAIGGIVFYFKFKDILVQFNGKNEFNESFFNSLSIIIIVLGIVVFIIAFCGCIGSVCENKCFLVMYCIFMSILMAPLIYAAVKHNSNKDFFQVMSQKTLNATSIGDKSDMTLHAAEYLLNCCGKAGPNDYDSFMNRPGIPSGTLPPTCCTERVTSIDQVVPMYHKFKEMLKPEHSFHDADVCLKHNLNSKKIGCSTALAEFVEFFGHILINAVYLTIVFEALELIGAIYLSLSINQRKNKYNKHY